MYRYKFHLVLQYVTCINTLGCLFVHFGETQNTLSKFCPLMSFSECQFGHYKESNLQVRVCVFVLQYCNQYGKAKTIKQTKKINFFNECLRGLIVCIRRSINMLWYWLVPGVEQTLEVFGNVKTKWVTIYSLNFETTMTFCIKIYHIVNKNNDKCIPSKIILCPKD